MSPHDTSRYLDAIASVRTRTAPSSAAVYRVRTRLDRQLLPTTDLLASLPSPTTWQAARVRARLVQGERSKAPRLGWLVPAGGLAFAAAAFAVASTWLDPQVAPLDDTVQGPEGTSAPVDSEALTLPTTAAGWLNHARALESQGADDAAVLAAADAGVALDADAAVRSELEVTRMGALLRSGLHAEALIAAESALEGAGPDRAEELHRAAARLALAAGDCARALPHLRSLASPTPEEAAHADRCAE